ncbi:MAG: beta-N-acetylhexosaminidase [Methylobacterium sp.]|jgi:beta-N-acetylhexosaminidase|nr:beta-N-acetylhexosaminidase [Methylobacterium sp.]MCA3651035.1 beta-N-acetylhexosaminidase [Methylobacterium sp.]MCA4923635.1 beta-N-acetylhexosaminidase [Methylobacterium sp.]
MKPLIFGAAGPRLTNSESTFFSEHKPAGFILFRRNIEDPAQVKALVAAMKEASGNPDALVLVDQEGGRVARFRPPHWPSYPPGAAYGALWRVDPDLAGEAAFLGARLIAEDLFRLGINVDCLPVLDVPAPGAHDVIGDRAYGREPHVVMALGRAAAQGLLEGGVLPVIKHIPGHGRAMSDSHHALPRVNASRHQLDRTDFPPFRALGDLDLAMTAHVVYEAIDPQEPATTSRKVITEVIRGQMGFDGLLMSDDLSMKALSGHFADRRKSVLAEGCDLVLHCNGEMDEMIPIAEGCPGLTAEAERRLSRALSALKRTARLAIDRGQAQARLAELLAIPKH